jgi:hypothetical protein
MAADLLDARAEIAALRAKLAAAGESEAPPMEEGK